MDIGQRVRSERQKKNLTVAALAVASSLSKGFISQIESGRSRPSLDSLRRISAALDVPLSSMVEPRSLPNAAESNIVNLSTRLRSDKVTEALRDFSGSIHVVSLRPEYAISGHVVETRSEPAAFCVCLDGMAEFALGSRAGVLRKHDVVSWNRKGTYTFTNTSRINAVLLFGLPVGWTLPGVVLLPAMDAGERSLSVFPSSREISEGPFGLVKMRAERKIARER